MFRAPYDCVFVAPVKYLQHPLTCVHVPTVGVIIMHRTSEYKYNFLAKNVIIRQLCA